MSPAARALTAALMTLIVGGTLNVIAVRLRWVSQFLWAAAVVTPLAVGLLTYWSAARR